MSKRTCMTKVVAVSAAAMLLAGCTPTAPANTPAESLSDSAYAAELEQLKKENAELRAQLEQQKQQVKDLQDDLLILMGAEDYLTSAATDPSSDSAERDARVKALEIYAAIQDAYADFDREKLEELIPQMDELISYLSPEMLNSYYMILEYVEQPSNG